MNFFVTQSDYFEMRKNGVKFMPKTCVKYQNNVNGHYSNCLYRIAVGIEKKISAPLSTEKL